MKKIIKIIILIIGLICISSMPVLAQSYCVQASTALPTSCTNGQMAKFDGTSWICSDTAVALPVCPAGQTLTYITPTTFSCTSPTSALPPCSAGQIPVFNGITWDCTNIASKKSCDEDLRPMVGDLNDNGCINSCDMWILLGGYCSGY